VPRLPRLPTEVKAAIVAGSNAAPGDFGFMAFVAYRDASTNSYAICSGTVVSPNVVLTAAHCAVDATTGATLDPAGYAIVTGSLGWSDPMHRQVTGVSRVIVSPAYDSTTMRSDAALLVLSAAVTAPSIRLAERADGAVQQDGTPAYVAVGARRSPVRTRNTDFNGQR
jgi:secreted trypsin-like serine protease